ncbi:MAG: hypothetical protein ACOCRB_00080 [Halanaerobiaceae bacterium]
MKKISLVFILSLVFTMAISGAGNTAALNDLVTVPTADMLNYQFSISGAFSPDRGEIEGVYLLDTALETGGIMEFNQKPFQDNYDIGPVIKLLLAEEEHNQPALAAGLENSDIYLVLSKNLGYGLRGHLGVGNGNLDGLFLGVNKIINPVKVDISEGESSGENRENSNNFPPVNLMAEYSNEEINLGARMNLDKNLYFDIGVINTLEDVRVGFTAAF